MIGIHGLYWLLPILTFAFWTTCIVGLLGLWAHDNFIQYKVEEAAVVFISDVGATHHAFFIIFCCLTSAFYILSTFAERHLRHQRRIPGSIRKRQTILDILSVICAVIGALGLIFLSIFDAFDYSNVHWSMTVVFVVFVALSVIFQTWQIFSLSHDYPGLKTLKIMAIIKTNILTIAIAGAIAFAATYGACSGDAYPGNNRCDKVVSAAAVCEWAIAFLLDLYFLTYVVDLWPAHRRAQKGLSEDGTMVENRQLAKEQGTYANHTDAPYAIDGVRENNTYYPSQAAQQYHGQHGVQPTPDNHNNAGAAMTETNLESSPNAAASTLPNSERGSLYQTPMTEARPYPNQAGTYGNGYNTYQA